MRPPIRLLLVVLALLALLTPAATTQAAPAFVAYHGATGATHQAKFNDLSKKGFRMISLSVYDNPASPRYAAVWVKQPGPAFAAVHGVSPNGYQAFFDTWVPKGYRPIIVTATGAGAGAVFAAFNTMYAAVATRTREIATLRALGFRGGPVVISVLSESLLLALVGGVIGAAAAWLAFDGFQTSTLNWSTFSQLSFSFAVTPPLIALGIGCSLLMGLIGGLFPALRAARLPVATALREL